MDPQGSVVCGADVLYRASSYGVFLMPDGSRRAHYGLDFYAPDGTEVRSPVAGVVDRVAVVADGKTGGNAVRIKDPTGEYHYAAHMLTPPLVRRGGAVEVGTPLGWVGRTGSAHGTHAHVHYEWRDRWGRVKNPFAAFLRAQGLPPGTRVVRGSISCPGGSLVISSHHTSASEVMATLVKMTFLRSVIIAFRLVASEVPGATPNRPASGLMA